MIGGLWKSTSSVALFAAAGLFVGGVAMPSAKAADLGGDCCADLEERVAELEATAARKGNRRVSLTISGQVQTSVMSWDTHGRFGGVDGVAAKDGSITFGAITKEVPPGLLGLLDDNDSAVVKEFTAPSKAVPARKAGNARDVYIVDNVTGGTFVNFAGNAKVNPSLTAGFVITLAINSGARSHQVNQLSDDAPDALGASDSTFVMTQGAWYLDHKQIGRLTVGRTNTATAGLTLIDLSGAGVINNSNIGFWNASFFVNNAATATGLRTWGDLLGGATVYGSATARANVIMYSSPVLGGFSVSGAWGENDIWDVALRYAGEMGGFRVAAGIGYAYNFSGTNEVIADIPANDAISAPSIWKGSASIMHVASGLFGNVAYMVQSNDQITAGAKDTTLLYLQGGISKNWTGLGNTVVFGEWARVTDAIKATASTTLPLDGSSPAILGANLGDAEMWGIGIVQNIDAAAMSMFLSYRSYSADFNSSEMGILMAGARIQF